MNKEWFPNTGKISSDEGGLQKGKFASVELGQGGQSPEGQTQEPPSWTG